MIVYAESSAVLAWLLGESSQTQVLRELQGAERVVSSVLTGLVCARGLARARASRNRTLYVLVEPEVGPRYTVRQSHGATSLTNMVRPVTIE